MTNKLPVVGKRYKHISENIEYLCLGFFSESSFNNGEKLVALEPTNVERCTCLETLPNFYKSYRELPEDKAETDSKLLDVKCGTSNTNSVYTKCFECGGFGTSLPNNKQCSNCNSYDTTTYYSEEDLGFGIAQRDKLLNDPEAETKPTIKENLQVGLNPEVKEAVDKLRKITPNEWSIRYNGEHSHIADLYVELLKKSQELINALDKQFANNKIQAEEVVDNKIEEESIWKPVSELPAQNCDLIVDAGKLGKHIGYFDDYDQQFCCARNDMTIPKNQIGRYVTLTDYVNNIEERLTKLEGVK